MCDTFGLVTNVAALTSASLILCRSSREVDRFEFVGFVTANFANFSPLCVFDANFVEERQTRGVVVAADRFEFAGFVTANFVRFVRFVKGNFAEDVLPANHEEDSVCRINHTQPIIGICAPR